MKLRVASWNIEGRLSRFTESGKGSPEGIVDEIEALDADILTLPEAYDNTKGIAPGVEDRLRGLGYKALKVPYENGGPVRRFEATQETHYMVLSKFDFAKHRTIRLGDLRSMPVFSVEDPETHNEIPITFFGIHLDERSSAYRLSQVDDFAKELEGTEGSVVAMGDFNDMHTGSRGSKLFGMKAVKAAASLLGQGSMGQLAGFAYEMAQGKAMAQIEAVTELRDADPLHRATTTPKLRSVPFMPAIRMIDIDHILISPGLKVSDYTVMRHDGGSDHRAISATIELTQ